MKTKKLIGKLMLFLLSFTFISCKTYKNSEVNSIGIIGSADGPTAIYIKVNPNFLIQKSLDILKSSGGFFICPYQTCGKPNSIAYQTCCHDYCADVLCTSFGYRKQHIT